MPPDENDSTRPENMGLVKAIGIGVVVLSLTALVLGMLLTRSLDEDLRSTVAASRSALVAIDQTIEAVDRMAADTATSLDSASGSVDSVSTTVDGAVVAISQMADLLDEELPDTIESIQATMPAAIQTANAIDGTLRALSLFGVDYDPEEPFGESLARVNSALAPLPVELRSQSEALRLLIPSSEELADETDDLSASMEELAQSLAGFTDLAGSYQATLAEAETAIEQTDASVEGSLWLIRALVIGMALAGALVGAGLFTVGGALEDIIERAVLVEAPDEEAVEA